MYNLARGRLVQPRTGIVDPVRQAIAAETGKAHQINVLSIVPMAQMPDETAERGGRHGIG